MAIIMKGFRELTTKMKQLSFEAPVATAFGSYEGMQEIMIDAKNQTPVETGTLRDSGYVTPPEVRSGAEVRIEAGFGGPAGLYVHKQHEAHATKSKFFERALDSGRGKLLQIIAKHVRNFLRTGRTTPAQKKVPATPTEIPSKNPRGV